MFFRMFCVINRYRLHNFAKSLNHIKQLKGSRLWLQNIRMATKVDIEFANFEPKLSLTNPVPDYVKLMDDKMKADVIMCNDVYQECWKKIAAATRETIWEMLFGDKKPPPKEKLEKVSELLKLHKEDAGFYQAAEYNKWIVEVRDELLKRNMVDFWRDEIVKNELGPCWARDSDLFDDSEDPEPAKFYKFANCEAPWLKESGCSGENASALSQQNAAALSTETSHTDKTLKKISPDNALEDYKHNMNAQGEIDGDDEDAYKAIFAEAREVVWELLFGEANLSLENAKKAAKLLEEYKKDACFYNPWDYNDWIPKVRDELLKRKYFDFWQNVIVKKELGLCWAQDSDYFDDMDDPKPKEFYKEGEALMKKQNRK